jgi:hypothetical protein
MAIITQNKAYQTLRSLYESREMKQEDLRKIIGKSKSAVDSRMAGRVDWTREEMYFILDYFEIPESALCKVFPRDIYEPAQITVKEDWT